MFVLILYPPSLSLFDSIRLISIIAEATTRKAKVDLLESLGALREQLCLKRSDYRLWSDGQLLLEDHRSLQWLGVRSGSRLVAVPKCRQVFLRLPGAEPVSLGEVRRDCSFLSFVKMASAALAVQLSPDTRFVCNCGRVLSGESAERRRLPRRCCEEEELSLTVRPPLRGESRAPISMCQASTEVTVAFNRSR